MRLRKMDANRDYQFGHNDRDFWYNQVEAVGQSILTRLLLFSGEWFLDSQEGTPWGGFPINPMVVANGRILGEHTEFMRDIAVQSRVLGTTGVRAINSYDSTYDNNARTFTVDMIVDTIYGQIAVGIQPALDKSGFTLNWSALGGSDAL